MYWILHYILWYSDFILIRSSQIRPPFAENPCSTKQINRFTFVKHTLFSFAPLFTQSVCNEAHTAKRTKHEPLCVVYNTVYEKLCSFACPGARKRRAHRGAPSGKPKWSLRFLILCAAAAAAAHPTVNKKFPFCPSSSRPFVSHVARGWNTKSHQSRRTQRRLYLVADIAEKLCRVRVRLI